MIVFFFLLITTDGGYSLGRQEESITANKVKDIWKKKIQERIIRKPINVTKEIDDNLHFQCV